MPRRKSPLEPGRLEFARQLRREATDAETLLWCHLRGRQLAGRKFRRQHPLPPYVLDFYCEELRLGIELDCGQHYLDEGREHDRQRAAYLQDKGIRLLRFSNREVLLELHGVLERIYLEMTSPSPLAPLPEGEGE
jgi:very-short-patch-repair endonuclease